MNYQPGTFKFWVYQVVIAFDQLVNAIHGGWADETISSRCGRNKDRYPYKIYRPIIDALFYFFQGPNHCVNAYIKEQKHIQLPPELR